VAGEPGIGKTTLVENFLAEVQSRSPACLIARGNCSERLADTEAYLPVLDALESLLRRDRNGSAARILNVVAPTWYAHVAPVGREATPAPEVSPHAASQRAMLREFHTFLQEATRLSAVVLFFDDVHWADVSTVDLLAHLGRHCQDLRVLIVTTLRPTELLLGPHPFHAVRLELQSRGVCTELPLSFLGRDQIERYFELAFGDHAFPEDFASLIHARTEGNPLFMADLVRDLRERKILSDADGRWQVVGEVPDLSRDLPQSVRGMIERKLDRLDQRDRHLLSAASIQGHQFNSLILADMLGWEAALVDERLVDLDRVHGLVRSERSEVLPDRSLSMRYSFVHILYQQALYHVLLPTRRAALSLSAARALETRHRKSHAAIAAELACLFEVGRDDLSAARYYWLASQNAARVFAHGEAVTLAKRGINLLQSLSFSSSRAELEMELHTTLGLQLQVTQGYGASAAKEAYELARQICLHAPGKSRMFPVIWGLWLHHKVRSELCVAQDFASELLRLARESNDPDLALQAHQALGMTAFCRGQLDTSLQHVEQAAALYDRQRHATHSFHFGQDPGVICKAFGAIVLWLLGYPDAAARQSEQAIRMSLDLSPSSQAVAHFFAAIVHQLRRDVAETGRCAKRCGEISTEHGFSFWLIGSNLLRGWSLASEGNSSEGIDLMRQSLVDWQSIGSITYRTYFLGLFAEAHVRRGEAAHGRRLLDEAITLARDTDERFYEPELLRLVGQAFLAEGQTFLAEGAHCDARNIRQATDAFQAANERARETDAKSLQLRAAISLARLNHPHANDSADTRRILAETLSRFSEGYQTQDLQEAVMLLTPEQPDKRR
jgi:adenylate cyclase